MKNIMHWGRRELIEEQTYTYATMSIFRVPVTLVPGSPTPAADLDQVLREWSNRRTGPAPSYHLISLDTYGPGKTWAVVEEVVDHGE